MTPTKPVHEDIYQEVLDVLRKYEHEKGLSAIEILATLANMVGKCIAMQDQTKYSAGAVMRMIVSNIEIGNQQMIESLRSAPPAGSA